jgi:hypothetical protein
VSPFDPDWILQFLAPHKYGSSPMQELMKLLPGLDATVAKTFSADQVAALVAALGGDAPIPTDPEVQAVASYTFCETRRRKPGYKAKDLIGSVEARARGAAA